MTETTTTPSRRLGYHVLLYAVGTALAAGALVCTVLVFAAPEIHGMQGLAVGAGAIASVVIAATAVHRKVDAGSRDVAVLAYELSRGLAYAEQAIAMTYRITDLLAHLVAGGNDDETKGKLLELEAAVNQTRADFDAEVRKARSEGYVEGVRERLSGQSHVVGWPGHRA